MKKMIFALFLLCMLNNLHAQTTLYIDTFSLSQDEGTEVLNIIKKFEYFDKVHLVRMKDCGSCERFGMNLGFEFFNAGEFVRVIHISETENGKKYIKTKPGAPAIDRWTNYFYVSDTTEFNRILSKYRQKVK